MKRIIVLAATACLILVMYWSSPYYRAESLATVQLVQPEINDILDTVTLHGSIIDPARKKLYAEGASRVLEVYVEAGERVKKGQALIRLERRDDFTGEQAAAASALGQLKSALEQGDLTGAESMLEEILTHTTAENNISSRKVYELYSPVDGMIMEVSVQPEEDINGLLSCIEISSLEGLMIEVTAGEDVVGRLEETMDCTISVPAFSISDMEGKIANILPYAKETGVLTGSTVTETTVQVAPRDTDDMLRPGYRASVKVSLSLRKDSLLLPYEAVSQDDQGNEYVLKLENQRLVKAVILTGAELAEQVEICDGLSAQDIVVMYPTTEQEGAFITIASNGSDDTIG